MRCITEANPRGYTGFGNPGWTRRVTDETDPSFYYRPRSPTQRESHGIVLCGGENGTQQQLGQEDVVMVGIIPCRLSSEVHVSGQRVSQGQVYKTGDQ
jgi:hypothetical protein